MSAPATTDEITVEGRAVRLLPAVIRIAVGMLWITNVAWKVPTDFGKARMNGLYGYTMDAVTHPVFAPYTWVVKHVVLPNFTAFGWFVLVLEACIGAFLLVGLATRFWAVVGALQTVAIMLSVLNAPGEWEWSYYLMILAHVAIFATAAGRVGGLDGLYRQSWRCSPSAFARLLVKVS